MPSMTLEQFARHITRCASQMPRNERIGLRAAGARVREAARGYIGEYQGALGPFPAWAPLADATVEDRVAQGFAPDDPLLRTGAMRRSIAYTVAARRLDVFSTSLIARYQEFGTPDAASPIPPRPFIGRAMAERGAAEARAVGRAAFLPLLTGRS